MIAAKGCPIMLAVGLAVSATDDRKTSSALLPDAALLAEADECRDFINQAGIRMIWVKPGKFVMGSPPHEAGRDPDENQVEVEITRGFWLGATEVTHGEWDRVMEPLRDIGRPNGRRHPAQAPLSRIFKFCTKLTERERAAGRLPEGYHYYLPTEAQWEFACRAGTKGPYAGDVNEMAWFKPGPCVDPDHPRWDERAREVAGKKPNAWGFHDMHGNLDEWCADWYAPKLQGGKDPVGPYTDLAHDEIYWLPIRQSGRVRRGGTVHAWDAACRSAARCCWGPTERHTRSGFRIALRPVPQPAR